MMTNTVDLTEIPAALPGVEADDDATRETLREKSLSEFTAAGETKQTPADKSEAVVKELADADGETDDDNEDEDLAAGAKPSKKKLFFAFVTFLCCFVLLVVVMCWFFGIGFFSATKTSRIDRTGKPANAAPSDEEKLKMALNLVADKNISANPPAPTNADSNSSSSTEDSAANSSITVPSAQRAADLAEPVIVPDETTAQNRNPANSSIDSSATTRVEPNSKLTKEVKNSRSDDGNNVMRFQEGNETNTIGRSLFFGKERKVEIAPALVNANNRQTISNKNRGVIQSATAAIPFGTLLPVRLLGAIYTLRTSGGLVRMELTRPVSGKNFAYPAGTILVGTLRGSEYKRAFVSIVGLIDPESGGLVKFTGEAMGGDGASGFVGRRRKVKSAWSRVLAGLRESAAVAVNAIGNRRSGGGTIVISDSTAKASGALSKEFSALVGGGGRKSDEFVEVAAGTNAFVLVTDLPDEISGVDEFERNSNNLAGNFNNRPNLETGLTDDETADLFAQGSPEKLRAALPRMTPRFRQLAEQALAAMENQ